MKPIKFDEIVKARAAQRIHERAKKFRMALAKAFDELHPEFRVDSDGAALRPPTEDDKGQWANQRRWALTFLTENKLPPRVWTEEEEKVSAELLATMDEMQKAFLAPPVTEDGTNPSPE